MAEREIGGTRLGVQELHDQGPHGDVLVWATPQRQGAVLVPRAFLPWVVGQLMRHMSGEEMEEAIKVSRGTT